MPHNFGSTSEEPMAPVAMELDSPAVPEAAAVEPDVPQAFPMEAEVAEAFPVEPDVPMAVFSSDEPDVPMAAPLSGEVDVPMAAPASGEVPMAAPVAASGEPGDSAEDEEGETSGSRELAAAEEAYWHEASKRPHPLLAEHKSSPLFLVAVSLGGLLVLAVGIYYLLLLLEVIPGSWK